MNRKLVWFLGLALALLAIPAAAQVGFATAEKTYQVTVTGSSDVVVTFTHAASLYISICNTGANDVFIHVGPGDCDTDPTGDGQTSMVIPPGSCPPMLPIRAQRVAFHKSLGGDTTCQMIVLYGRAG